MMQVTVSVVTKTVTANDMDTLIPSHVLIRHTDTMNIPGIEVTSLIENTNIKAIEDIIVTREDIPPPIQINLTPTYVIMLELSLTPR